MIIRGLLIHIESFFAKYSPFILMKTNVRHLCAVRIPSFQQLQLYHVFWL